MLSQFRTPITEELLVSDRPFKVLGIQQIAIGGLDKSKLSRLWVDTWA